MKLRGMVFIDGRNFESAVNKLYSCPTNISYEKLTKFLETEGDCIVQRTYYYTAQGNCKSDPAKFNNTQKFVNALNGKTNFIAKTGRLSKVGEDKDGNDILVEKETDVNIAVDMVSLAYNNAYDVAILCSADTDYIPVMNLVRSMGKRVIVSSIENQKSGLMKGSSDSRIQIKKSELDNLKV